MVWLCYGRSYRVQNKEVLVSPSSWQSEKYLTGSLEVIPWKLSRDYSDLVVPGVEENAVKENPSLTPWQGARHDWCND